MNPIQGKESLFYIKYQNEWFPVSCLTGSPFSESSDMIDTTTRDSNGWKTSIPTLQSYTIQIDGLVVKDDEDSLNNTLSYRKLREFKRNRNLIEWKIEMEEGYYIDSGKAYISDISQSDNVGEMISFSASLVGFGKPEESNAKVYVLGEGNDVFGEIGNIDNLIEIQ